MESLIWPRAIQDIQVLSGTKHRVFHYLISLQQNADHTHMQARTYVQMLWPEQLVAVTPDPVLSTTGYIQKLLPVCPSFSLLSGSGSVHRVSYQTNNRYFLRVFLKKSRQTLTNSTSVTTLRTIDCAALGLI